MPSLLVLVLELVLVWGLAMAAAGTAWADARDAVLGRWTGDRSVLEVSERDGSLSARVIAVDDPVYREGEKFGPFKLAEMWEKIQNGNVTKNTHIWTQALVKWTLAGNVPELAPLFDSIPICQ